MKLLQELNKSTEKSSTRERQRARIYAAVQKLLDKEFSGNDALATDLLSGMMDFYDSHLHVSVATSLVSDLKKGLGKGWQVYAGDNGSAEVHNGRGTVLVATVAPRNGEFEFVVFVQGNKKDIPVDAEDVADAVEILKDISKQGQKWYVENDPDNDEF